MPRVIVAVTKDVRPRIAAILSDCELRFVDHAAELAAELAHSCCNMLIVGLQFDESSGMDALEQVLRQEHDFPVVCVRGRPFSRLGTPALQVAHVALGELGARNFIDLLEYPDDAAGNARVRALLHHLPTER